jgi:hypothetical protein
MLSLSMRVVLVLVAALLARPAQTQEPADGQSMVARTIFAEEYRWPAGIIALANGSFVVQWFAYDRDQGRGEYVLARVDGAGHIEWRTPLWGHMEAMLRGSTRAATGIEYHDAVTLLNLWQRSANDDSIEDRVLLLSEGAGGPAIVVADSVLGLWRLTLDGRVLWHRHLLEPVGLTLLATVAPAEDGALLAAGLGKADGDACAPASVVKIDEKGATTWRWRFEHDKIAYATHVLSLARGRSLVVVESQISNRYLSGAGKTPCSHLSHYRQWLIWLDGYGHAVRQREVPLNSAVLDVALLGDGRIALIGWLHGKNSLFLRILSADGRRRYTDRTFDVHRLFGWSRELWPARVVAMEIVRNSIVFVADFRCDKSVWPCHGQGVQVIVLAADGRLRRMPDAARWHPTLAATEPGSGDLLLFSPAGSARLP